jgi:hypothetical protein
MLMSPHMFCIQPAPVFNCRAMVAFSGAVVLAKALEDAIGCVDLYDFLTNSGIELAEITGPDSASDSRAAP